MIDIMSVAVGLICGGGVGFIFGKVSGFKEIDQLKAENERLYREYSRVSTRGPGGRFIKTGK